MGHDTHDTWDLTLRVHGAGDHLDCRAPALRPRHQQAEEPRQGQHCYNHWILLNCKCKCIIMCVSTLCVCVCSRHSLSPDWRGVVHCALNTAACTKTFFFPAQSMEMIEQIIMVMISMLVGQEGVNLFIVFYPWLFWQLIHIVVNVRCMWWEMMRNIVPRIVCGHGGEPGIADLMRRWWQIIKEFSNKHISCLSTALGTQHIFTSLYYVGHINILCCQSRGIDISSRYMYIHCIILVHSISTLHCTDGAAERWSAPVSCIIAADITGDHIDVSVAACYEQFFGYIIKGRNIQIHKT